MKIAIFYLRTKLASFLGTDALPLSKLAYCHKVRVPLGVTAPPPPRGPAVVCMAVGSTYVLLGSHGPPRLVPHVVAGDGVRIEPLR